MLRTALLFVRSAVRLVYAELPWPVAEPCRQWRKHLLELAAVISYRAVRDTDHINSELQRLAALRRAARERGGQLPSIDVADALLDERRELAAAAA